MFEIPELASLGADAPLRPPSGDTAGAVAAVLVPLPHTAHGVAALEFDTSTDAPSQPIDRSRVPAPDRVAAGWSTHLAGIPTLDAGDPAAVEAYEALKG